MGIFIRNPHTPLYLQVYELIKKDILEGVLAQGDRLPSEEQLAKKYSISRMTLRKSIAMLIKEGLIFPQQGVGTFISKFQVHADYTKLTSFSAEVKEQGQEPGAKILSIDEIPFDKEIYKDLNLDANQGVICVKRLRTADHAPVAIQYSYFPKDNFEKFQFQNREEDLKSIFVVMENSGFILSRAVETISACIADSDQAALLEISPGDALLFIKRITFSNRGDPLESVRMYVRPDRYHCTIILSR
jgi:GntR family transcriptional regulator